MNWPERVAAINGLHGHEKGFRHRIGSGNDTGLWVKPGDGGSITIVTEDLSGNGRRLLSNGAAAQGIDGKQQADHPPSREGMFHG